MGGSVKPQTLCAKCKTPSPTCPWKYNFTPVEGWEAEKTKIKIYDDHMSDSYRVISCPLFEENTREKPVKINEICSLSTKFHKHYYSREKHSI